MVNEEKVRLAARMMLEAIGEDPEREGLRETPDRIARMCTELFAGMGCSAEEHLKRTFTVETEDMVLEKDIVFYSVCEHHFLPFFGRAHIAYIPDGKVAGLSKLARTVEVYARRPQLQEQMTSQIADAVMEHLAPKGVMVMLEAEHMCMAMRGVRKPGTVTSTMAVRGAFCQNEQLQNQFFAMLGYRADILGDRPEKCDGQN